MSWKALLLLVLVVLLLLLLLLFIKAVICMPQEQFQVASMASLISWQANADAVAYGAAMIALANRTDINTLQDVVDKTVS